ncbi:MAG: PQQ-binding-like beta-propeller repeat protein, partial [Anaerolineales bacterium]|nr:PQQ-binding-like beta-propeller repeat protein [Anaerolineales bacterium]
PPHLHFEIRTHMPVEPGPGYWSYDPTLAGWLPPSKTIWRSRIEGAPGVQWVRDTNAESFSAVGVIRDTIIAVEDSQLIGVNILDGSQRWTRQDEEEISSAALSNDEKLLYVAYRNRLLMAFEISSDETGEILLSQEPVWEYDLDFPGTPVIMPLSDGSVIITTFRKMAAISSKGTLLWDTLDLAPAAGWTTWGNSLIYSTWGREKGLWSIGSTPPQEWTDSINGRPLGTPDGLFLYAPSAVYRLDPETKTAVEILPLYQSGAIQGDIIVLPDGNLLVAHADRFDRRLIVMDPTGNVTWERSIAGLPTSALKLLLVNQRVYLLLLIETDYTMTANIYAVDFEKSRLDHIFTGGTRSPRSQDNWFLNGTDDVLFFNIGGGSLQAIDLRQALDTISGITGSDS